jgi:outer membrane receptor protein involved in Fe transport
MKQPVLVAAFLLATAICAQAQTGGIAGRVTDESGAVLAGAAVSLTGPAGTLETATGPTGEYSFTALVPGSYVLTVRFSGFSPAQRDAVQVGEMVVTLPPITLRLARISETVVVTASRGATELIDAPVSTSVLTSEAIASSPGQSYTDLLRAVPGLNVVQLSARDTNLTSRQATGTAANSQLALVDGRTIYLDFFGLILWDLVPTSFNDVKQIEVVRGPTSAIWGANALSGVVNIITKPPREALGTTMTLTAGALSRDAGSTEGRGPGLMFGAGVTHRRAVDDRWAYRIAAGYFQSAAYPRPAGRIPVVVDPRDPARTVGGEFYPADRAGELGRSFENAGTQQPKFEVRVDQEIAGGRVTYAGGVAGTEGIVHTGIGPFAIQQGTYLGYGSLRYNRRAWTLNAFANLLDGKAPNLLVPDPLTGGPLALDFKTQTYDVDLNHVAPIGTRHVLTYGGNVRQNNFTLTVAPGAENRTEAGGYVQDEIFAGRWRVVLGARVDKFGNIDHLIASPRASVMFKPNPAHSIRYSFNKAFRAPSTLNNYFDVALVTPVDLSGLAPLLPPPLDGAVAAPFPLVVKAVGSEIPIGGRPQSPLREESVTANEVAYTGTWLENSTVTVAFYVNDTSDQIDFSQLAPTLDPYTAENPPPNWPLPPAFLTAMAQQGIFLPRTAFTYLNLGPVRNKGLELSLDHRFHARLTAFANYSWQARPKILDAPNPYPTVELALPPTHRFNVGASYNGQRYLANGSLNYSSRAFWSDVLTTPYHGFTDGYGLVNGSFGVKWAGGRITTSVKSTNLLNQDVQQHIFGDILKRSVTAELKFDF